MSQMTDPPSSWGKVSADLMIFDKPLLSQLLRSMSQSRWTKNKKAKNFFLHYGSFFLLYQEM